MSPTLYLVRKATGSARWVTGLIAQNILANVALSLRLEAYGSLWAGSVET